MRKVLSDDSWITLNGCNNAWVQAPALSRLTGRPVLAAATGTDFEQLYQDGSYYFNNQGQSPASGVKASRNDQAYDQARSCSTGACLRMNPAPAAYHGFWGDYGNVGGLGFYKFFCNYDGLEKDCYKTMARFLQAVLSKKDLKTSNSRVDYLQTVYDLLCPISAQGSARQDCIATIENKLSTGDENYNPYNMRPADCGIRGCRFTKLECKFLSSGWATPKSCHFTVDPKADGSRTLMHEVKNYLRGMAELGIHE